MSDQIMHFIEQRECPYCHATVSIDPVFEDGDYWEMCPYCEKEFEIGDYEPEAPDGKSN